MPSATTGPATRPPTSCGGLLRARWRPGRVQRGRLRRWRCHSFWFEPLSHPPPHSRATRYIVFPGRLSARHIRYRWRLRCFSGVPYPNFERSRYTIAPKRLQLWPASRYNSAQRRARPLCQRCNVCHRLARHSRYNVLSPVSCNPAPAGAVTAVNSESQVRPAAPRALYVMHPLHSNAQALVTARAPALGRGACLSVQPELLHKPVVQGCNGLGRRNAWPTLPLSTIKAPLEGEWSGVTSWVRRLRYRR